MTKLTLEQFYRDGGPSQDKYAAKSGHPQIANMTTSQLIEEALTMCDHMGEEVVEVRRTLPRRKWKVEKMNPMLNKEDRDETLSEMVDVLLFHRAVLAYLKVDIEEFMKAVEAKLGYNKVRTDHIQLEEKHVTTDQVQNLAQVVAELVKD